MKVKGELVKWYIGRRKMLGQRSGNYNPQANSCPLLILINKVPLEQNYDHSSLYHLWLPGPKQGLRK